MSPRADCIALLVTACLAATAASAQTNDEINSGIQFNFSAPGARSLAMGGAFIALADDATAAYANPAGLTHLIYGGPEVSVESRSWHYDARFPHQGRHTGELSGIGVDTVDGVVFDERESTEDGLSFLSVGYVLENGITVAAYRHQLANFAAEVETDGTLVNTGGVEDRINPIVSTLGLGIVNFGLSAAWEKPLSEIGDAGVSIGVGISYYRFDLSSATHRFAVEPLSGDPEEDRALGGIYGPADRLGDNVFNSQFQRGEDDDWTAIVGVLWKIDDKRRWTLGAVYRHGASFDVDSEFVYGPGAERQSGGTITAGTRVESLGGRSEFNVPESLGVGIAYSDRESRLRALLDVDFVRYSRLSEDLANLLLAAPDADEFEVDDGVEIHLGMEYVVPLAGENLIGALRCGGWYEPAHKLEYIGNATRLRARFPEGEDDLHWSAGFGLAVGESFQIDAGVDFGDRSRTTSLSAVWFF